MESSTSPENCRCLVQRQQLWWWGRDSLSTSSCHPRLESLQHPVGARLEVFPQMAHMWRSTRLATSNLCMWLLAPTLHEALHQQASSQPHSPRPHQRESSTERKSRGCQWCFLATRQSRTFRLPWTVRSPPRVYRLLKTQKNCLLPTLQEQHRSARHPWIARSWRQTSHSTEL